jgi:hypothetical protein
MPLTQIAGKATYQVKIGSGYLKQIVVAAPGSAWTLQVNDVGQGLNSAITLLGTTPLTVPAAGTSLLEQPLYFGSGLQVITAGTTAGELDLDWI